MCIHSLLILRLKFGDEEGRGSLKSFNRCSEMKINEEDGLNESYLGNFLKKSYFSNLILKEYFKGMKMLYFKRRVTNCHYEKVSVGNKSSTFQVI